MQQVMKAPYDEVKLDSRLKAVRQELARLKSRDAFHHSLRPAERYPADNLDCRFFQLYSCYCLHMLTDVPRPPRLLCRAMLDEELGLTSSTAPTVVRAVALLIRPITTS
jgi:hypothetical protein